MVYKVIITEQSQQQFERYLVYIVNQLRNQQAAKNLLLDYRNTRKQLSIVAGSLRLMDDNDLKSMGYRKINFQHHRYVMVYRIHDDQAVVYGIYHSLQDYKDLLK